MTKYNKLMLLYEEIYNKFNPISYGNKKHYYKYKIKGEELNSHLINGIINECVELNQLSKNASKKTYYLIKNTILAKKSVEFKKASLVQLKKDEVVQHPKEKDLPKGLVNIIELLKRSLYHSEYHSIPSRDSYFDTARLSFNSLKKTFHQLDKKT